MSSEIIQRVKRHPKLAIAGVLILIFVISVIIHMSTGKSDKVSFTTLEAARAVVNDNAKFNANAWKLQNRPELVVKMRGDSSQTNECPQGDGWVSVDLVNKANSVVVKLKCSSVSQNLGCMTEIDFAKRQNYSQQDGKCNKEIPFPLPKITSLFDLHLSAPGAMG